MIMAYVIRKTESVVEGDKRDKNGQSFDTLLKRPSQTLLSTSLVIPSKTEPFIPTYLLSTPGLISWVKKNKES